jgi:hypothetical protein
VRRGGKARFKFQTPTALSTITEVKMVFSDDVGEKIQRVLPNVTNQLCREIVEHLIGLGLKSIDQLKLVKEEDLETFLDQFDCRTLVAEFKTEVAGEKEVS